MIRDTIPAVEKMSRQVPSQARKPDRNNIPSSLELTANVTLRDLNIECRKILRKALLRESERTSSSAWDVYLTGPCFPSEGHRIKTRLGETCTDSLAKNSTYGGRVLTNHKSPCVDGLSKTSGPSQAEDNELEPVVNDDEESVSKTKIPIMCLSGLTEEKRVSEPTEAEDECLDRETTNELVKTKLLEEKKNEVVSSYDCKGHINLSKLSKDEILKNSTNEDCSHQKTGKTDCENSEINRVSNPSISRPSSSRLDPSPGRLLETSMVFAGSASRLSSARSSTRNSTKNSKSKRIPNSSDEFSLDHISNPLLRDSLRKILNPQNHVGDFDANAEFTREQTPLKGMKTLFEDDITLPNISGRYRNQPIEGRRSRNTNGSSNVKHRREPKSVRFAGDKPPELTSTKCAGFTVIPSHPVRMLSPCSEYAVKGLIGQWLKRRSGSSVQTERERKSMEKQENYREVQFLKVGLSMRMLAGIV